MRYGTVPIVRATGGLMDTVVDVSDATLRDRSATGFHFGPADAPALAAAVRRALALRRSSANAWRQVMRTGMKQEFDWARSAAEHAAIYSTLASSKSRGR
jgi:starch synthase